MFNATILLLLFSGILIGCFAGFAAGFYFAGRIIEKNFDAKFSVHREPFSKTKKGLIKNTNIIGYHDEMFLDGRPTGYTKKIILQKDSSIEPARIFGLVEYITAVIPGANGKILSALFGFKKLLQK